MSVLFFDNSRTSEDVVLIDASKLGEECKENNLQKRRLRADEIDKIVETFISREVVDDFSAVVTYDEIKAKKYSLAAGQYFEVKVEYVDLTPEQFTEKMAGYQAELRKLFAESDKLKMEILEQLSRIEYE